MTEKSNQELKKVEEYKVKEGFINGTGRRKTATARVFLYEGEGDILVNHMDINDYFPSLKEKTVWMEPFHVIGVSHPTSKYNATIKVEGSGKSAQLDAVQLGFARALAEISDEYRTKLSREGLLTRDPRMVERKKYYLRGARKRPQFSKR